MALAVIYSDSGWALPITIEVDISRGMPGGSIVSLPETAVKESKDRLSSALLNNQFAFPTKCIKFNQHDLLFMRKVEI